MALARLLAALVIATAAAPAFAAQQTPPPEPVDDWPRGAPRDEYQFTAWCYGALRTHMDIFNTVKPELDAISKRWKTEAEDKKSYAAQQAAGKQALDLFTRAMRETEKASIRPLNTQGAAAIEQGRRIWADLPKLEPNYQAYSWMNWELPARCEKVATALENKSMLMGQALKSNTKP